jgi:hypothetical protein
MSGGRPTKYQPEYPEQAAKLCTLGAKDTDLANFFDVSVATINNWKIEHPEFLESLSAAKQAADARVVRSLYERATGYNHPEDKIFQFEGSPVIVPTIKHYPPDTTACIFWLKNRNQAEWRDKQDIEHSGNVTITASALDESI